MRIAQIPSSSPVSAEYGRTITTRPGVENLLEDLEEIVGTLVAERDHHLGTFLRSAKDDARRGTHRRVVPRRG